MSGRRALLVLAVLGVCLLALVWLTPSPTAAPHEPPPRRFLLATESPVPVPAGAIEPRERYPVGSRVVATEQGLAAAPRVVLSDGFFAAGGAAAAHDGHSVLFVGRRAEADPYGVYLNDVISPGEPRPVETGVADVSAAAFLPDGRVVYSAALEGARVAPGSTRPWALFVTSPDEGDPARITFSAGLDLDPTVLRDGRVAYVAWVPDPPGAGRRALFTVHPDGTGAELLHGRRDDVPWMCAPRETGRGTLLYCGGPDREHLKLLAVDERAPLEPAREVPTSAEGVRGAEPTCDGGLLVAGADGVHQRDAGGLEHDLPAPPDGFVRLDATEVGPRPRPQGHLSMVKPSETQGRLLLVDARPEGRVGEFTARLFALAGPFRDGAPAERRRLGTAVLAADGSLFALVPADVPLVLEIVDGAGELVAASRWPFWVRPNESRGFLGVRDDPDTMPPNRRPLAVLQVPLDWTGAETQAEPQR